MSLFEGIAKQMTTLGKLAPVLPELAGVLWAVRFAPGRQNCILDAKLIALDNALLRNKINIDDLEKTLADIKDGK